MANDFTAGVYTTGTFATANPTTDEQQQQQNAAQDLTSMGVVVLASMHVHDDGSIYFDTTPMISGGQLSGQLNPNLPTLLQNMSDAGTTVLASFGGGGTFDNNAVGYYDYLNIKNLIAQYPDPADNPFFQNLTALFQNYPAIYGFDIDLETYTGYDPFHDTLVTLIKWLQQNGRASTIAPYDAQDFWVRVLQKTINPDGVQAVSLVNLQNASGTLSTFVDALRKGKVGWLDIPFFILAGQQISQGTSACEVQSTFYGISQEKDAPRLRGGWLWRYEFFDGPASDYVDAIQQGLGGSNCTP